MQSDTALQAAFDRDGYVHVAGFFTPAEMDELEQHLNEFIREVVPTLPKSVAMYEDYSKPESLKQFSVPQGSNAYFDHLWAHPKMLHMSKTLLRDEVVPKTAQYFSKPPGMGKPTPPHQDGYYFCLVPNEALTIWLALDDVDDENGALHYIKGSHKKGVLPHGASHVVGFSQGLTEGKITEIGEEVTCRARRGDVLIHHSLTVHAAGANRSQSRKRRAIGMVYYAQRAKVDPELQRKYQESLAQQRKAQGIA